MQSPSESALDYSAVERAAYRITGHVHRTPVLTSTQVDLRTGCKVFFKCENLQRIGAFKYRGAFNAIARLDDSQRLRGVITFSSGNHAQAVALAASELGTQAVIVMPEDAPQVKVEATRGYGAEVVLYNKQETTRESLATKIALERGLTVIPPYDHPDVIAGQGTAAMELFEEVKALDYFFVPVGGGGLISGCAIATSALDRRCKVIGVEPSAGDDATRSFHSKTLQTSHNPETVADGARTPSLGQHTFPVVLRHVHEMVTVDDEPLLSAMFYLWERMKLVVEPTGVLGIAALFEKKFPVPSGARVGVLLSGGNVDVRALIKQRG